MPKKKESTFEELLDELRERADRLEEGDLTLDASLALYEEGAQLVEQLRGMLDAAELRISEVNRRLAGSETRIEEVEGEYEEGSGDD